MAKELHIEISIAKNFEDNFDHWGYYDSVDEAIEALFDMKVHMDEFYEES